MFRLFKKNIVVLIFALAIVVLLPQISRATQQTPKNAEQIKLTFAPVVKKTAPAVVNIYTKKLVKQSSSRMSPFMNDPFFKQFFGNSLPHHNKTRQRVQNSLGSGVIIDSSGLIISNAHVVKDSSEIVAVLNEGEELKAELVFFDERLDLALLKVNTHGKVLPHLEISMDNSLEVGDLVLAIGNPFGVGQTVTSGIVSAVGRTAVGISDFNFFIQTDAAINPGNSGGALIDMDGKLVGINTAIFSKSGGSLGIGFSIPVSMLKAVMQSARSGSRYLQTPWIGLSGQNISKEVAENLGMKNTKGILANYIHPKGPAKQAGLKLGDVIVEIEGIEVKDPAALRFNLVTFPIGMPVSFKIFSQGKYVTKMVTPILPPEEPARNETELTGEHPLAGVIVANLSPAVLDELGGAARDTGVIVLASARVNQIGLRTGDIILSVNGNKIKLVKQLKRLLKQPQKRWHLEVQRGPQVMSIVVTGTTPR